MLAIPINSRRIYSSSPTSPSSGLIQFSLGTSFGRLTWILHGNDRVFGHCSEFANSRHLHRSMKNIYNNYIENNIDRHENRLFTVLKRETEMGCASWTGDWVWVLVRRSSRDFVSKMPRLRRMEKEMLSWSRMLQEEDRWVLEALMWCWEQIS